MKRTGGWPRRVVEEGERYGLWTVIRVPDDDDSLRYSLRRATCRCDCGEVSRVRVSQLTSGSSMGCKPCRIRKHGRSNSRRQVERESEYTTWVNIKARHRGDVDERWAEDYLEFLLDVGRRPRGHRASRLDPSRPWGPDNFEWTTGVSGRRAKGPAPTARKVDEVAAVVVSLGRLSISSVSWSAPAL